MKLRGSLFFGLLLVFGSVLDSLPAYAATPGFTVSATDVTMPSSGDGSIPFTLTSVNGYVGTVVVQCPAVNAPTGARVPICGEGPLKAYSLTADGAVTNTLALLPYGSPVPVAASALLFGFGLWRKRKVRWPTLALVLMGSLVILGGFLGCGGGTPGMTPGTYAYTVTATDLKTNASVSTTANVTVR